MPNVAERIRRHGLFNAAHALALKALHSLFAVKILRGVHVQQPDAAFLKCPEAYNPGFLTRGELRDYVCDPRTEISSRFLDDAMARGDECYAIRDGETLAAYGWYASSGSTPIGLPDLVLRFNPDHVYMYKGFTDTRYRGQRLHAIGMTRALERYVAKGYRGIVSYVEATNFDSLKSCFRMGYKVFGSIYVIRVFGRHYAFSSPGCRRFGFRLDRETGITKLVAQRLA